MTAFMTLPMSCGPAAPAPVRRGDRLAVRDDLPADDAMPAFAATGGGPKVGTTRELPALLFAGHNDFTGAGG